MLFSSPGVDSGGGDMSFSSQKAASGSADDDFGEPSKSEEAQGNVTVIKLGDLGKVTVSGAAVMKIEKYDITDPRLSAAWKDGVYRVLLNMNDDGKCRLFID